MTRILIAGALVTCLLSLSAWLPGAAAKQLLIVIENVAFGNTPTDVHAGDTIEWLNKDFVAHTATARDGSFDLTLPPGKSARVTLRRPGAIAFFCHYHPNMTGILDVGR